MSPVAHLWLALSPHGFGHAAMTAPIVAELRRRVPGMRLTIQTSLDPEFLASRYGREFVLVPEIPDFGMRMRSATAVDLEASLAVYGEQVGRWDVLEGREADRLASAAPDLVLANIPYLTIAAAARAGLAVVAYSSLNWLDILGHYAGERAEARPVLAALRRAYDQADLFLRPAPAMEMSVANRVDIGPVAVVRPHRGAELRARLGLPASRRIGLISFGGIAHDLPLDRWPRLEGWHWLCADPPPGRDDLIGWQRAGVAFGDLLASVDVLVTKIGYGAFSEAGVCGTPVLYQPRPDWPESPHLDRWLQCHTRSLPADSEQLLGGGLPLLLQTLFDLPRPPPALPTGIAQAADILEARLLRLRS